MSIRFDDRVAIVTGAGGGHRRIPWRPSHSHTSHSRPYLHPRAIDVPVFYRPLPALARHWPMQRLS